MVAEEIIHKVVDEISFGLISPKDLRKQSVVEIQTPDTYDEDGAPITAGLMDGRLGNIWNPGKGARPAATRQYAVQDILDILNSPFL